MIELGHVYLEKAKESLEGAQSELANRRYNNSANRSYYACFQAAVSALIRAGVIPSGTDGEWKHEVVQAGFAGTLIRRRKLYPSSLSEVLMRTMRLRHTADYGHDRVTEVQATRAVRRAYQLVEAVERGGERA